jgi:WD40 repeat protein
MFRVHRLSLLWVLLVLAAIAPASAGDKGLEPQRLGQPRKNYEPTSLHRTSIAYSPDGKKLAWVHHLAESPEEGGLAVVVWEFEKGFQVVEMTSEKPKTYARSPIRFMPNGKMMVIGCFQPIPTFAPNGDEQTEYRNNVQLWQVFGGRELAILPRSTGLDNDSWDAVMVGADGKTITAVSPKLGRVWDFPDGKQIQQFEHAEAQRLVLSQNCQLFAGTLPKRGGVAVFSTADGKEVVKLPGTGQALEFSPDGKRLATWQDDKVVLWEVDSAKQLWGVPCKVGAESLWGPRVAFAPDGKRIAWNEGRLTKVADADTGKVVSSLKGERGPITFSPDGQKLALACPDGTALVWDVK